MSLEFVRKYMDSPLQFSPTPDSSKTFVVEWKYGKEWVPVGFIEVGISRANGNIVWSPMYAYAPEVEHRTPYEAAKILCDKFLSERRAYIAQGGE